MRKILTTGVIAIFLIGIVYFFFRVLVVDILQPLFRPILDHVSANTTTSRFRWPSFSL